MNVIDTTKRFVSVNAPYILAGLAITSAVGAVVVAVKAHDKAQEKEVEEAETPVKQVVNVVRARGVYYVPAAVLLSISAVSVGALCKLHISRTNVLDAAYRAAAANYDRLQKAVDNFADDETKEKIKTAAAGDPEQGEVPQALLVGEGTVLCYDEYSGRYFRSTMENLRRVENNINSMIIHDFSASLNDFYDGVGLERVSAGDDLGWTTDRMLSLMFGARISDNGVPCLTVAFELSPVSDWNRIG